MTPQNPEKTSRQRKLYVAVLALALGGLAVDRLFLGGATGPQDASAEAITPGASDPAAAAAAPRTTTSPNVTTRANTLAGRLDRLAAEQGFDLVAIDDAFRPSASWVKPSPTSEKAVPLTESQAFLKNHRLMAVVNNAGGGAAIIDNQTVTLGKQVDGFTLVAVTQRSAILEKFGQRVELTLPDRKSGPRD